MATMNKVRLPDNTEVDIQDKRIEDLATVDSLAVDSTPTAGSTHLITSGGVKTALDAKQDTLVSGTSIKTINSGTLLGSGDIVLVSAIGTSGNNLTYTKGGTTSNVTVPYATKADNDGDGVKISTTYLKKTGDTITGRISLGETIPIRTTTANTAPMYGTEFNMRGLTGYIEGLKVNSSEGDWFYCVDRNSEYTVTSNYKNNSPTPGEYGGSDCAYLFDLVSANRFMLYCGDLETTPWVLTITKNSGEITATDVLDLWFFQTGNVGYLNSYKIEVLVNITGQSTVEWFTVIDRDNVRDRMHAASFPIWLVDDTHGIPNHTYGNIRGVRVTIRKADPTGSWSTGYLPICAVQLRDRRPKFKPSAGIGAMDMRGGYFYGDVTFDYGTLTTKQLIPRENNTFDLGSSTKRWNTIYGNVLNLSNSVTSSSFVKSGGTSSQFLKADGSVDSSQYAQTTNLKTINDQSIVGSGNIALNGGNLIYTGEDGDATIINGDSIDVCLKGLDDQVASLTNNKQATLVSGTNIKTINSQSLLGGGNISITQEQADWNEDDDGVESYIKNKPDLSLKEDKANKVTSLSSSSTDTQYPSAKCVYDIIGDIETLLAAL